MKKHESVCKAGSQMTLASNNQLGKPSGCWRERSKKFLLLTISFMIFVILGLAIALGAVIEGYNTANSNNDTNNRDVNFLKEKIFFPLYRVGSAESSVSQESLMCLTTAVDSPDDYHSEVFAVLPLRVIIKDLQLNSNYTFEVTVNFNSGISSSTSSLSFLTCRKGISGIAVFIISSSSLIIVIILTFICLYAKRKLLTFKKDLNMKINLPQGLEEPAAERTKKFEVHRSEMDVSNGLSLACLLKHENNDLTIENIPQPKLSLCPLTEDLIIALSPRYVLAGPQPELSLCPLKEDLIIAPSPGYVLAGPQPPGYEVVADMETHETGEENRNNPKNKQMSIGRKKFNIDPKKGIEYLIENGLLQNNPNDIAQFLYEGEGLNKIAIGDYLGERSNFNQQFLDAFVCLHNFTDLILVQALRQFLWSFRLPREAQKIDQMMERFAHRYCELNTSIFQHPDTCFVLSFSIIRLNTSLHNPAVKDKQTLEQFINMNRGIDNGNNLPRQLLENLYESIKTEPFKIPEDNGNNLIHTFFNPNHKGWLWKQGGRYNLWNRRWFILNDKCLYYFQCNTDKQPKGTILLENNEVRVVNDRNKPNCFELYATSMDFIKACKTDCEGKVVEVKHTVYRMSAHSVEEKDEWINYIKQSIRPNPFYDLLAKRKKIIQNCSTKSTWL